MANDKYSSGYGTSPSSALGTPGTALTACAEAGSIAKDLGDQYQRFHGVESLAVGDGSTVFVVPQGKTLVSAKSYIDAFRTAPERRAGTATMQTLASFVAHVNRFKDADSAIFASRERSAPSLTAVLDYHEAGGIGEAKARFGTHRAVYAAPLADEWKAWRAQAGKNLDTQTFAEFIEERLADVLAVDATGAALGESLAQWAETIGGRFATAGQLLGLSRNLQVNVSQKVKTAQTLDSGEVAIAYEETHNAKDGEGKPIRVPNLFVIAIPVFYAGDRFPVPVRLKYRMANGQITWTYTLHQPEKVFDLAFDELCATVERETTLPLFVGAPES